MLDCLLTTANGHIMCYAELFVCCATADVQIVPAALAACAAKHWLARNAQGVKLLSSYTHFLDPSGPSIEDFYRTVPAH